MVFRRDSKVDAFQRQISALRHQLGAEPDRQTRTDLELVTLPHDDLGRWDDLARFEPGPQPMIHPVADPSPPSSFFDARPSELSPVSAIDEGTSILSHTTTWTGNLDSSGSLHVHGRVEGSLSARDCIFVAEEADVEAVIRAATVTIAGRVIGSVHCTTRFEILPRGRVDGDIHSPLVVVHEGATITGDISMTGGGEALRPSRPVPRVARGGS